MGDEESDFEGPGAPKGQILAVSPGPKILGTLFKDFPLYNPNGTSEQSLDHFWVDLVLANERRGQLFIVGN